MKFENKIADKWGRRKRLTGIAGIVPRIGNFPPGCRFTPRGPMAKPECPKAIPERVEVEP